MANEASRAAASTTAPSRPVGQVVTNVPDDRRTTTTPTTTTTAAPTVDTGAATGAPADLFVLPLTNEVTKGYSDGKPAYSETMNDWRVHNGVDFKGETGQTVKALADGTILKVEEDALWGKVVTIDHGFGIHSRYCGLDAGGRKAGQTVKVGEAIGQRAKDKGIDTVVFDRGGYLYHGRVKALAEGARKAGLEF